MRLVRYSECYFDFVSSLKEEKLRMSDGKVFRGEMGVTTSVVGNGRVGCRPDRKMGGHASHRLTDDPYAGSGELNG